MKLPKQERRKQLLDTAMAIVRERGADELTLGNLAERAGVSRPIAYEHFSTRAGLLIALYRRIEEKKAAALREALARARAEIGDMADVISRAYFTCHWSLGPEAPAISAALKGSEEMAAAQRTMIDGYVDIMCQALRPFTEVPAEELRLRCIGLLGAAEMIAHEMQEARVDEAIAVRTFASLIVNGIGQPPIAGS